MTERFVPNSKIGVVIVHGLAEHKGRYNDFIDSLADAGISVFAIDLRGHGESDGKRGDVQDFGDFIDDLHDAIKRIKSSYPKLKLALFGHSIGGLIASVYCAEYSDIHYLILSSPSLETPKNVRLLRLLPYKLLPFIKIRKRYSESKEMLAVSRRDPLSCHYMSLRLLGVAFVQGIRRFRKTQSKMNVPILVMGGGQDKLVNWGNFENIFADYSNEDKTIEIFEKAKHRLVQNEYKEEAVGFIIDWLRSKQ